jgi:hypothetical protein
VGQGSSNIDKGGASYGEAETADSAWGEDKPGERGESDEEDDVDREWPEAIWTSMNHGQRRHWIQRRKRRIAKDGILQRPADDGDLESQVGVGLIYDKVEAGEEDISSVALSREPEDKELLTVNARFRGSSDEG